MSTQPRIVYHTADLDGRGAAAIALLALSAGCDDPDIPLLIPFDYNWSEAPIDAIPDGALVYMLDISLPPQSMHRLAARCQLVWIDHHTPRIRDIQALGPMPAGTWAELADVQPGGCLLTWRHFHPHQDAPAVVTHIDEWDTATQRRGQRWDTEVRPLQFGLRSHGLDPDDPKWQTLLYGNGNFAETNLLTTVLHEGLSICRSLDESDRAAVARAAYRCSLPVAIDYATGSAHPFSMRGDAPRVLAINKACDPAILLTHPAAAEAELLLGYSYEPSGWRLSLSPGPKAIEGTHCGQICRALWNGGGHPGRAGATLPSLPAWLMPGAAKE